MATNLENLQAAKSSYLSALAAEAAYQEAYGPKPSYSLDGESYQWTEWREAVLRKIKELNILMQQEDPVWCVRSRARS